PDTTQRSFTGGATVAPASSDPPVSSATRADGASTDMRSHGTATTASETPAALAAARDTVGSAGFRAGPCSIFSPLRKPPTPAGVLPEAVNPGKGGSWPRWFQWHPATLVD